MTVNAQDALQRLKEGNERFRTGKAEGPGEVASRHKELLEGQSPFAVVLTCSDSRVPPEIVFDTGLGDLFVVRVAGNVANQSNIASIEYALAHLGSKLVVVVGHESCGAVAAAMAGGAASEHLGKLLSYIEPALEPGETDVNVVSMRNAQNNAAKLIASSDIVRSAMENDGVKIMSAFFHFTNGEVKFD